MELSSDDDDEVGIDLLHGTIAWHARQDGSKDESKKKGLGNKKIILFSRRGSNPRPWVY